MARLNDEAQWIILMGFIVSFSFFFLALVINQSTLVGQTTAESVLDFPKNDIRDVRNVIISSSAVPPGDFPAVRDDITAISLSRKTAVVHIIRSDPRPASLPADPGDPYLRMKIHYNNGVTFYNENWSTV